MVGFSGPLAARYKLTPQAFEAHLCEIAGAGVEIGMVEPGRPLPAAALTFDDGGASATTVAEALERRGWRGHFFVTTSRLGAPGFLTAAEVADLAARGHCIGSHSHTHPTYMGLLGRDELAAEWETSGSILARVLGRSPAMASVPGGFLSPEVVAAAAAAGYRVLMTSEPESRVRSYDGLLVLGRYTIWATTPASTAAAYARGSLLARSRLWLEWKAKLLAKRMSPMLYERGRRVRAWYPGG